MAAAAQRPWDPQRCGPVDENDGENAGKNMKKNGKN